mmetsp:Transcript_24734/g.68868  ORF Transcript_24734/g.68868 Transcript_24734/m.68868 type:complete len:456 (+) Transcript_24734:229-1596(+)
MWKFHAAKPCQLLLALLVLSCSAAAARGAAHPVLASPALQGDSATHAAPSAPATARRRPSTGTQRRSTRQLPRRQGSRVSVRLSRKRQRPSQTATTGVTGFHSNGTKLSGEACAVLFTGDDCQQPIKVPDCMSGVFQGEYWVLNRQHFRDTNTSNTMPLRKGYRGVVPDLFQKIQAALPPRDVFSTSHPAPRCALVGSDRSLRLSSWGQHIDGFDVVMRMNGAPTEGFERHVGSRTTHRFVNNAYVGWREGNETVLAKWAGSVQQLLKYSHSHSWVINPKFLEYSQSRRFTSHDHLCTQGFRALLILMHTCREVHVFGFDGGTGWYYDKLTNRLEEDKARHRGALPKGVEVGGHSAFAATDPSDDEEGDDEGKAEMLPDQADGGDDGSNDEGQQRIGRLELHWAAVGVDLRRSQRRLLAPGGHKIRVERSCMRRLVAAGIIRHHSGRDVPPREAD